MSDPQGFTRRRALRTGAATFAGMIIAARSAHAQSPSPAHAELLQRLAAGRTPQQGRVRVRMPEIAENGSTVPITVTVESPMTAENHVKTLLVVSDGNPRPEVFSATLTPAAGKAEISTRIRVARTMNVIAYADMSDGTLWAGQTVATVTIGGCGS